MIFKLLISSLLFLQTSIYEHSIPLVDNSHLHLSSCQGKKLLFVNIATGSEYIGQLEELQQLQLQYNENLVIVIIPSNSFGKEHLSDQQIKDFFESKNSWNILVGRRASVVGADISPLYHWLCSINENGMMESIVKYDFQKFLVEENGKLVGVFSGQVSPLALELKDAIEALYENL